MRGITHLGLGLASGSGLAAVMEHPGVPDEAIIVVAGLSALVPDLDEERSLIYRLMFGRLKTKYRRPLLGLIGLALIGLFPQWGIIAGIFLLSFAIASHRGFTHSLVALAMITALAFQVNSSLAIAAAVGYWTHLLADLLTPSGIPLYWPLARRYRISRIPTGSLQDRLIGAGAYVLSWMVWMYTL